MSLKEAYEKMHSGDLYIPTEKELFALQLACLEKLYDFNNTRPSELERRGELLSEMFCEIGEAAI